MRTLKGFIVEKNRAYNQPTDGQMLTFSQPKRVKKPHTDSGIRLLDRKYKETIAMFKSKKDKEVITSIYNELLAQYKSDDEHTNGTSYNGWGVDIEFLQRVTSEI